MYGVKEIPARSVTPHLDSVDFPATPDEIASAAADGEATPQVVNVLKCLPRPLYARREDVLRDLSEAARRFAAGPRDFDDALRDRRNIGRGAAEERGKHP
jgi:hypothetical protein